MEPYRIYFQPSVEKDLRKLSPENCDRLISRIETLANEPISVNSLKLKGTENLYRIRVGDYRIVYEFNASEQIILIHYVRHRSEVYRDL